MTYTIKGFKTFRGMEGEGFNAVLCRDGKKVALVDDDANGGPLDYHWADWSAPKVEVPTVNWEGKPWVRKCTPEEAEFVKFVRAQPGAEAFEPEDTFVCALVDELAAEKKLRRWCKTQTVVRVKGAKPGDYVLYKVPYSPKVAAAIRSRFPDVEEIVNERFVA